MTSQDDNQLRIQRDLNDQGVELKIIRSQFNLPCEALSGKITLLTTTNSKGGSTDHYAISLIEM